MRERLYILLPAATLASGIAWAFAARPVLALAGIAAALLQWLFLRRRQRRAAPLASGERPVVIPQLRWPDHG